MSLFQAWSSQCVFFCSFPSLQPVNRVQEGLVLSLTTQASIATLNFNHGRLPSHATGQWRCRSLFQHRHHAPPHRTRNPPRRTTLCHGKGMRSPSHRLRPNQLVNIRPIPSPKLLLVIRSKPCPVKMTLTRSLHLPGQTRWMPSTPTPSTGATAPLLPPLPAIPSIPTTARSPLGATARGALRSVSPHGIQANPAKGPGQIASVRTDTCGA